MSDVLLLLALVLQAFGAFMTGLRIGRSGERDSICQWMWRQPKSRSGAQITLDVEHGVHRRKAGQ